MMLSVTVILSPLVTGDPSTPIDTCSVNRRVGITRCTVEGERGASGQDGRAGGSDKLWRVCKKGSCIYV